MGAFSRWGAACGFLLVAGACPESCLIQRGKNSVVQREAFHQAATQMNLASKTAPKPVHPGKGIFGDQIEFLGYDLEPAQPVAGGPVQVTFYFHALRDVSADWEIFVHIDSRGGRQERINGDHYPVSGRFHTDQWKGGDYVTDRFAFVIPDYQTKSALDLWIGFYSGDDRLPISNPKDCQNDGNNRLLAATIQLP
jgi:hypothetical protein